jgi:dihydrofolate reductase
MVPTCSVYIATSVDGFIARPDGSVDWLERPEYATGEPLGLPYEVFIGSVDALVMGRHTFETVLGFGIAWPYQGTPVTVLSSRELVIPDALRSRVTRSSGSPDEVLARLAEAGARHVYVDGGDTVRRFLRAGRIDHLTITCIPVLLGDGIPLFGAIGREVRLEHLATSSASNGFVQTRYRVVHDE